MKRARVRQALRAPAPVRARVQGNDVALLHDGRNCFPAMLAAIDGAAQEILLEMYWFGSDKTGRRFAEALMGKAREGVSVRVIYDAVGSWDTDGSVFQAMRAAGVRVLEFSPIAPWRQRFSVGVVNNRDHRKLLVVDGSIGFTGGVNLADQWAPPEEGGAGWRDDMIQIEGPAVTHMRDIFLATWAILEPGDSRYSLPEAASDPEPEGAPVRILASEGERRSIAHEYLDRIERARSRIYIANSYFLPDRGIRKALARAAGRGVDVRVLVPGESDVLAVQYASQRLYGPMMRAGIRIYEWQGTVLHTKSASIDGQWCTVGSYNLDHRSWRYNLEVTAVVEDPGVAGAMERRFVQDLDNAFEVDARTWRFRPLSNRVLESSFYLFRRVL